MITSPSHPVLLCGTDAEGDSREIPCRTVERAQEVARAMMADTSSEGIPCPPWQAWTIWHNDAAQPGAPWVEHSSSR